MAQVTPTADEGSDVHIQQSPLLEWIDLTDDRGVKVWNLDPSFDHGNIADFSNLLWATMIEGIWDLYSGIVALAIWFISWVLEFGWVEVIAVPMRAVGDSLQALTSSLGVVPVFLTIAAIGSVFWMMKGKWSTGVWELFSSLIVAALLTGSLASPVSIVGAQDGSADQGLVHDARDIGIEIAAELTGQDVNPANFVELNPSPDPDLLQQGVNASLVTTFLRTPLQLLNFGIIIDGTKCEEAYTKALKDGPYVGSDRPEIRDAIKDGYNGSPGCGEDYLAAAEAPGPGQVASGIMLIFAAMILLVFGVVLSGSIILAVVSAFYQSLRLMVTLLAGLLPGVARGSMWLTFGNLAMSLILIVFSVVFTAVYILLINSVMGSAEPDAGGGHVMMNFLLVDVMLVLGIILYWRARGAIRNAGRSLAQAMAWRPGGEAKRAGPTPLPNERGNGVGMANMGMNAAQLYMMRQLHRGGGSGAGPGPNAKPGSPPSPQAGPGSGPVSGPGLGPGPTRGPGSGTGGGPAPGSGDPVPVGAGSKPPAGGGKEKLQPAPTRTPITGSGSPTQLPAGPSGGGGNTGSGVGARTTKTAGKLALLASESAAAVASGGTSTTVSAGARAARTARTAQKVHTTARHAKLAAELANATTARPPAQPATVRPQVIKGEVLATKTLPPPARGRRQQ